jgi:RNA polymerase sigma-54 factor
MKPSLGLRTSQQLALTPQLQQSIRLLQMSTAELEQEIERFLSENPLLEAEDNSPSSAEEQATDTALDAMEPGPGSQESWSAGGSSNPDEDWQSQRPQPVSLHDHLFEQACGFSLSERDMAWLEILIESVDEDGYLRDSLEELEEGMSGPFTERFGERLDADEQMLGLKLLQSMEPAGIGARSVQECLSLQLDRLDTRLLTEPGKACLALAKKILAQETLLNALGAKEFSEICRQLHCSRDELRAAIDCIQKLNPKPGSAFSQDAAQTVIPDVIAYRTQRQGSPRWDIRVNEAAMPRLSINPVYAGMIRDGQAQGMQSQLQEARWVIKNIQQRFDTILRVAQAIADQQQDFFERGELAMRPLVLREIAEQCGLHESTVSRVTNNKYLLTPRGTFELKYFFASHVSTESGGTASSTAIRAKIKQWVSEEDPRKPLSDQQIADRFCSDGVQIARRTIAKYREALRIEPVSQRKKL